MIRRVRHFYALKCSLKAGLLVWLIVSTTQAYALPEEQGPFLKNLLSRAKELNYQISSGPKDPTYAPRESSKFFITNSAGELILTFDYQGEYFSRSSYYQEHIFNLRGAYGPLVRELLKGALPTANEHAPELQIFLRSISLAIKQSQLLAIDLVSYLKGPDVTQWMSRIYLMLTSPSKDISVQFLPAAISDTQPDVTQNLPLISLELSQIGSQLDLHYLRYLVPAHITVVGSASHLGIDMKTAHESLDRYRRFAVTVQIEGDNTTILPSIYDGQDVISDVALEIYALSNYIQAFLQWYTPIWLGEFPLAENIHIKRNALDSNYLELSLFRYRAHICARTLEKDISSH